MQPKVTDGNIKWKLKSSLFFLEYVLFKELFIHRSVAAVTSGLLIIVKTGITIASYFGNVTASMFALTN